MALVAGLVAGLMAMAMAAEPPPPPPPPPPPAVLVPPSPPVRVRPSLDGLAERSLAPFQIELLDLAVEVASAIPIEPHLKDRSRAQYAGFESALELGQPRRALAVAERIGDWRRGLAYVDLALLCVRQGQLEPAQRCLQLGREIADTVEDWRRDRIRVKIAQVEMLLGNPRLAAELAPAVAPAEQGALQLAEAQITKEEEFAVMVAAIDERLATGSFDLVRPALQAAVQLHGRFYADAERRTLLAAKIEGGWQRMPIFVRLELLMEMAEGALAHGDQEGALALVEQAQELLETSTWRPEHRILRLARLAGLRHRVGDVRRARADADTMREFFQAERQQIVDIYRAGALRALAEAYAAMADQDTARTLYKEAVAAGLENPNARPRAEDLAAICRSLAVQPVEPDAELWERLRQARAQLGDPW